MDMGSYLTEGGDPTSFITEGFLMGAGALGIVAVAIGIILLLLTLKFAISGETPQAIISGFAFLTLISPGIALVVAILLLLFLAVQGNPYLGVQAIIGFVIGLVIIAIAAAVMMALVIPIIPEVSVA